MFSFVGIGNGTKEEKRSRPAVWGAIIYPKHDHGITFSEAVSQLMLE